VTSGHHHVLVSAMYWDSVLVLCTLVLKMAQNMASVATFQLLTSALFVC